MRTPRTPLELLALSVLVIVLLATFPVWAGTNPIWAVVVTVFLIGWYVLDRI